jgi:hypothetical protein
MSQANESVEQLAQPDIARHHRIDWAVQRLAWLGFAGVLGAALAGWLGPGPFSRVARTSADEQFTVRYHTIEHYEAPAQLEIDLPSGAERQVELRVGKALFDAAEVDSMSPLPLATDAAGGDPVLTFQAAAEQPLSIRLRYTPNEFGALHFAVSVDDGRALEVRQFILP